MLLLRICRRCEALLNIKALQLLGMTSTRAIVISRENEKVLHKLGFKPSDYKRVLPKKRTIRELNLQRVADMLNRLGFTGKHIQKEPKALWLHPYLIDHRFKLMEESGVERKKITLERIRKFARLNSTGIHELKKTEFISQETDVVHSILSFSNLPPEFYPPKTSDEECLGNAQTIALQIYISWMLGLSKEEVERRYQSYEDLHQKSIRLVKQCYDVLVQRFEMSDNKIKQNMYLLEGHPENFLEILQQIPMLGNSRIQNVASTNSKILMRPVYKMLKILKVLKRYNIPEESVEMYSSVLTLSPDTVKERCATLYADPVFTPFFCSPRMCFIIARYHTSTSRSQLLADMKWRCLSVTLLTSIHQEFQRRINMGNDEYRGTDTVHYLKRHLGYENKEIRNQLKRHPFFYLIPLTLISETVQFLMKSGICKSEIFKALPIVLYPKEKVARWLQQVHRQPEVQHLLDESGCVSASLVLQLVLYFMERPYHFSGHGVWSEKDITNIPYLH